MAYIIYENGFFVDRTGFFNYWIKKGMTSTMIDALTSACQGDCTKENMKKKIEDGSVLNYPGIGKTKYKKMCDIFGVSCNGLAKKNKKI